MSVSPDRRVTPDVLLLGPMRVLVGEHECPVRGGKQRALLARLVLNDGRAVSVEALADDLWRGDPPRDTAHAVQAHVSRLRATIAADVEFVDGAGYRLARDSVATDARAFLKASEHGRALLDQGRGEDAVARLDEALALWRGPALGDLATVTGLRPFALQLEERRRSAVSHRVDAMLACHRGEAVIGELRTALEADPLQEHCWRQLMLALHQAERHREALATYHSAREAFIEELGTEPSPDLSDLHVAILRREVPGDPGTPAPPARPRVERAPDQGSLVGRDHALQLVESAWRESNAGLRVVTLSGEPGVGKTRLAAEFASLARAAGAQSLSGRCSRDSVAPYEPFADILRASLTNEHARADEKMRRHAAGLTRVLADFAEVFPEGAAGATALGADAEYRSMDAVAAWLSARAMERPLVMVIDDLQWADDQTMLLLHHLMRSPRGIHVLIIVTVRDPHLVPSTAAQGEPRDLLPELLRQSDVVTHVPLETLTDHETGLLLAHEVGRHGEPAPLPAWAEAHVRTASGGNPLFVVELARQLLAAAPASLQEVPQTPPGLRDVIESHVSALPNGTQSLLRRAAVIGTEFESEILARVCDQDRDAVDRALDPMIRARLIAPVESGGLRFAFSHDVVRTVLYETMPPMERARLHTQIADVLESRPGHHRLHELAHHHRMSDDPRASTKAARCLGAAGVDALERGAPAVAERAFTDALALIGPGEGAERCDLLIGLGRAQLHSARPGFRSTLLEAARLAAELADPDRLTAAVLANSRGWWSSTTEIDHERLAGIETALSSCDPDDLAIRAQLLAAWATENVRDPASRDDVLDASASALALAESSGDTAALALALKYRFQVTYALFEEPVNCVLTAERLLDLARRSGDRGLRLGAALCVAQSTMRVGEFSASDRHLTQASQLAIALNQPPQRWLTSAWSAMRLVVRGQWDAAEALIAETYEFGTRTEQADAFTWFAGQLFTLRMMQNRLPEIADQVHAQVDGMAGAIPAWRAALALTLVRTDALDDAAAILHDFAGRSFSQLPQDMLWLNGMCYLSMTCEVVGDPATAADLYRALLPHAGLVANNGTIDAGPVDLQLGVLARQAGDVDASARHFHDAAALCRRIDAPAWLEQVESRLVAA
ncbi:BTAD domain-containing putative transcriptional regulator [Demequina sp. SO4-18]|uniref:BTAD domain-containing putative transcriptional regulator n=1 Tax=Demequina sp. SO4-18 TaxID=3401026 RepID=UPI003B5B4C1D